MNKIVAVIHQIYLLQKKIQFKELFIVVYSLIYVRLLDLKLNQWLIIL